MRSISGGRAPFASPPSGRRSPAMKLGPALYPPPVLSGVRDRNQFRGSTFHRWLAVDACALLCCRFLWWVGSDVRRQVLIKPSHLAPLRQGFFRAAGSALRHRNQLLGSKFCRGLPPNSGARLLVIDPHCWWARTSGGKSPLRRLSPALVAGLFFCGCFRKSETKCPAPSPARSYLSRISDIATNHWA